MGFFKGVSNDELKSLLETHKEIKTNLMIDVDELIKENEEIKQEFERYKKYVLYFCGKDKVNDIRLAMQDRELD